MEEISVADAATSVDDSVEAVREFAAALGETAEYQAFDRAELQLRRDSAAQAAIRVFQEKQEALGWQLRLGLANDAERAELQRLHEAMLAQPAVRTYVETQQRLQALCQEAVDVISKAIGLDFAAGCGPGCACG